MRALVLSAGLMLAGASLAAAADGTTVTLRKLTKQGAGDSVGTVTISKGDEGTVFTIDLTGLPPGEHGFHVHANGSCDPAPNDQGEVTPGQAAGGHWAPDGSKRKVNLVTRGDEVSGVFDGTDAAGDYAIHLTAESNAAPLGSTRARFAAMPPPVTWLSA